MLLCLLFTLSTSNLFTRPLVDLSTYHVTLYSCSGLSAGRTVLHPTATAANPSWYGKNQNYYSNSRLDLDSLIIYDKEKYTYSYLSLSRDTYERLHNIDKTGTNDTLPGIFTKRDEKNYLGLEGIRFSSRNRQDSCIYRFEVSQGVVSFIDRGHKTKKTRLLRTYFNGYGYYNVKTSKLKIYLLPYNAYAIPYYDTFQSVRLPLTGRYLIYELTKVQ